MAKTEAESCADAKRGFWATLIIFIVILVVVIAFIIWLAVYVEFLENTFLLAFYNQTECETVPQKCGYLQLNPTLPTEFPDAAFSNEIALLGAQTILNLEYLQENNGNLNIPPGLTFAGNLQGCPNCSLKDRGIKDDNTIPLGYLLLDTVTRTLYISYRGAITSTDWQLAFAFGEVYISQMSPIDSFRDAAFSVGATNAEAIPPVCNPETVAVHSGFAFLFQSISKDLSRLVAEQRANYDRIVFYGHSLGGPLASLSAAYFALYNDFFGINIPFFVYTYGKPRVGNVAYANCVNTLIGTRFWRMQNEADAIPDLPLSTTPNFTTPTQPWIYNHEGQLYNYQLNWGSQTLAHSLNNYIVPLLVGNSSGSISSFSTSGLVNNPQ